MASKIFLGLSGILSTKMNLKHAEDTKRFVTETLNCIRYLLGCCTGEVVHLALVRGAGAVPEAGCVSIILVAVDVGRYDLQSPLQSLVALKVVGKAELVLFIGELEKVEEFRGGLVDCERW